MDGPVHRIAIDGTGTEVAIAYGREVVAFEQNTLCESRQVFARCGTMADLRDSLLDQCSEVARTAFASWPRRTTPRSNGLVASLY